MTDKPDVEKWLAEVAFVLLQAECDTRAERIRLARACLGTALRAAAADGFRLVRVPGVQGRWPGEEHMDEDEHERGVRDGWNACRTVTLASAVEVGE